LVNNEPFKFKAPTNTFQNLLYYFLPDNEIHEIGLLYINYEIFESNGYYANLFSGKAFHHQPKDLQQLYDNIRFYFRILLKTFKDEN